MTLAKDGRADSIHRALEWGFVAEERDQPNSDSNKDKWRFIAKRQGGDYGWKIAKSKHQGQGTSCWTDCFRLFYEMVSQVRPREEAEGKIKRKHFLFSQVLRETGISGEGGHRAQAPPGGRSREDP